MTEFAQLYLAEFLDEANQAPAGVDDVFTGTVVVANNAPRSRFLLKPRATKSGRLAESLEELCAAVLPSSSNQRLIHLSGYPPYSYRLAQKILLKRKETFASCDAGPFIQFPNGCIITFDRPSDGPKHTMIIDDPWHSLPDTIPDNLVFAALENFRQQSLTWIMR